MKMSPLSNLSRRRSNGAFTLIELLVVVAIIALLAAGSVGGYGKVMNMVKAATAKKVAVELAASVSSYYADYDTLPVTATGSDWDGDTKDEADFLAVLAATGDVKMNSKKHNYLDGFKQAKVTDDMVKDGIDFSDPTAPKLYDPWGQPYIVYMDTNYDGEIQNPIDGDTPAILRGKRCIIYSTGRPGPQNAPNTVTSEFIKSW